MTNTAVCLEEGFDLRSDQGFEAPSLVLGFPLSLHRLSQQKWASRGPAESVGLSEGRALGEGVLRDTQQALMWGPVSRNV